MSSVRVGAYTLTRPLASGGTSELYLARDAEGREVVLKRLHHHCALDPTVAAMFRHEAALLRALDHPALPRVLGEGEEDRRPYLVLERVDGPDLATILRVAHARRRTLPPGAALSAVLQLLDALGYVHGWRDEAGTPWEIVHRDVSPGNVLITLEGRVKLVDFGLATSALRADPDRGVMKGTRGYMAPEVITGAVDASAATDLFAVGVILFEATTPGRLYEGPPARVLTAIVDDPVPSPATVVKGYPPALDAVVRRALAKAPSARFPSAAEMASALTAAARASGLEPDRPALARVARALTSPR